MNTKPSPPRDLSPMWLDLSHVVAGLPLPVPAAPAAQPAHPAGDRPRRGPPRDELPGDDAPGSTPATRWMLCAAAQAAGAGVTAALLMLMGLGPV